MILALVVLLTCYKVAREVMSKSATLPEPEAANQTVLNGLNIYSTITVTTTAPSVDIEDDYVFIDWFKHDYEGETRGEEELYGIWVMSKDGMWIEIFCANNDLDNPVDEDGDTCAI